MKKQKGKRIRLIAILMILFLTGCNSSQQGGTIRVGVRESVPGFGYKNRLSGTYSGMEIEFANKLATAIGYDEVEFVGVTADTREQVLRDGEVDFVVATYTITEERQKEFDFSAPYYTNYLRVMVQNSSLFEGLADLKGRCIGVSSGSTAALYLAQEMETLGIIEAFDHGTFNSETFQGGVTFKNIDTYPELNTALEEGVVDAICTDRSILMGYLTEERSLLPEEFTKQDFGVCMPKGSAMSEKVQAQVEQWRNDGQMDELLAKWDLK